MIIKISIIIKGLNGHGEVGKKSLFLSLFMENQGKSGNIREFLKMARKVGIFSERLSRLW